jgi:serine phosphatase RsbU (regulator of sigma subunit)
MSTTNAAPVSFTLVDGTTRRTVAITHSPFSIGRLPENDLVLAHPFVSRRHAELILDAAGCFVLDQGSRHGTFVNGQPVAARHLIGVNDTVHFGALDGPSLRIHTEEAADEDLNDTSTLRDIIDQIPGVGSSNPLDKLRWFFESARKLNTSDAVDQILAALLDTTLQLTQVERGYVFLRNEAGEMALALGRNDKGEDLTDVSTVSHGAMRQAISTSNEFIVTDTLSADPETRSASMVAHSIRSVTCIPLRKRRPGAAARDTDLLGLLYLDSRLRPGSLTQIDNDLLHTIATDAAALIDNAQLAVSEERERVYRQEMNIAADIQRGLMTVRPPTLSWAKVAARSVSCRECGGDFFDIVEDGESLAVIVADISGKGISAAILGATLQGLIYSLLVARQPLATIADIVNRYICSKNVEKYATMAILRIAPGGQLEYINCGHVPPFLYSDGCTRLTESNLPVGLIEGATFSSGTLQIQPGAHVLIVTDGVTEAAAPDGEFYGEERLAAPEFEAATLDDIFLQVERFAGTLAADDDCTVLDVRYLG